MYAEIDIHVCERLVSEKVRLGTAHSHSDSMSKVDVATNLDNLDDPKGEGAFSDSSGHSLEQSVCSGAHHLDSIEQEEISHAKSPRPLLLPERRRRQRYVDELNWVELVDSRPLSNENLSNCLEKHKIVPVLSLPGDSEIHYVRTFEDEINVTQKILDHRTLIGSVLAVQVHRLSCFFKETYDKKFVQGPFRSFFNEFFVQEFRAPWISQHANAGRYLVALEKHSASNGFRFNRPMDIEKAACLARFMDTPAGQRIIETGRVCLTLSEVNNADVVTSGEGKNKILIGEKAPIDFAPSSIQKELRTVKKKKTKHVDEDDLKVFERTIWDLKRQEAKFLSNLYLKNIITVPTQVFNDRGMRLESGAFGSPKIDVDVENASEDEDFKDAADCCDTSSCDSKKNCEIESFDCSADVADNEKPEHEVDESTEAPRPKPDISERVLIQALQTLLNAAPSRPHIAARADELRALYVELSGLT